MAPSSQFTAPSTLSKASASRPPWARPGAPWWFSVTVNSVVMLRPLPDGRTAPAARPRRRCRSRSTWKKREPAWLPVRGRSDAAPGGRRPAEGGCRCRSHRAESTGRDVPRPPRRGHAHTQERVCESGLYGKHLRRREDGLLRTPHRAGRLLGRHLRRRGSWSDCVFLRVSLPAAGGARFSRCIRGQSSASSTEAPPRLPGIGQRTAQRLAFHILRSDDSEAFGLADAIREVKEKVGLCEVCFNLAEGEKCRICEDESRNSSLICVVEEPSDVIPIERTGEISWALPRARGRALADRRDRPRGPEDRRARAPRRRRRGGRVSCSPPTRPPLVRRPPTTSRTLLRDRVTITRLASGLPVGADLEHADEVTLGRAFAGRLALDR